MAVCRLCIREAPTCLDWSKCVLVSDGVSGKVHNWHEELSEVSLLSYKDCYYKYTQFTENDPDQFSQFICESCASCVREFHFLVEKSVESKLVLQQRLKSVSNEDDKTFDQESQVDKDNKVDGAESGNGDVDVCVFGEFPVSTFAIESTLGTAGNNERRIHEFENEDIPEENFKTISLQIERVELNTAQTYLVSNARRPPKRKCTSFATKDAKYSKTSECPHIADVSDGEEVQSTISSKKKKNETTKRTASNKDELFLCSQCSLTFKNISILQRHEKIHDKNRERKEICPKCGLKLFTKVSLKQHMDTHVVNREKKHKCEFCDKAFFNRGACNIHMRIHLGTMLQCPLCPKQLFRQIDLDRHMASHSLTPLNRDKPKVKYYPVKCRECDKEVRSDFFKEHQSIHMNKPMMQCTLCNKDFFGRAKCNDHMKRYHKRKPREYEDIVYYYERELPRYSHLMIKQRQASEHMTLSR